MSIQLLKSAFESIQHGTDWSLQLLRITTPRGGSTKYASRQITLEPANQLDSFVHSIAARYLGTDKWAISKRTSVMEYDGTTDSKIVYKLQSDHELISEEYEAFVCAVSTPDVEADSMTFTSAYVIKGSTIVGDEDLPIKLVSMQNPVTTLKHKYAFCRDSGKFQELNEKVLNLRPTVDIIVIGSTVYFLTMNGENLFNMERAYKAVCHTSIETVESTGLVSGIETFKAVAGSGHNPRRFVSFNSERLEALKNARTRKAMAKQFNIPLDADGKFDANVDGAAERIVKMLCNKGMVDPFKMAPVEVSGAKPW